VRSGVVSLADAISLASGRPADLLGIAASGAGTLRAGGVCDLLRFAWDGERLRLRETVVRGETVHAG
jgi:alpha-D-ribose 1-methylphosphonate 5-triphosphate diphosphatase PhnM